MNEVEIKLMLAKKATEFISGGFKPTNSISESWIGRVYLYHENEEIPLDNYGELMLPLFQLCLNQLPFVPKILEESKIITVFISKKFPMDLTPNGNNWVLREYKSLDNIVVKDLKNDTSFIKPFPLLNRLIEEDYPVWEDPEIPDELSNKINQLEDSGVIDSYYDIIENNYGHKIGGYATYCQSGIDFGEDFEFVFQIASDEKANLNIIDSGNIYLAKNRMTGDWVYYCDFY
ncbi:hypothetical protein B0A67_09525 [Flavobacterium aquidurense]|jgi:hypothetical protein|uniref:DUF1963 domain-containing protein n=1 Tax=Flavobacterium aquidurense TaxID=362413 RepID=UPI00091D5B5D|nr:DUF1963 domain-containing protein [Flavobacterium aquidurense]OXA72055.1 hypothetical protein B0A67_09525 [Flavobacterium aquidurense]SHH61774.1 protein of unknown function [Flavobacterium frigidimaris]